MWCNTRRPRKSAIIKRSTMFLLIGVAVFLGCNPATEAGAVKAARVIEAEFGALKRSRQLFKKAIDAGNLQQARKEAQQVAWQTAKLRDALNAAELVGPKVQISPLAVAVEFAKMETDQSMSLATTVTRIRNEPGPLRRESEESLRHFVHDFLCFNLEKVVTDARLPSQDEYLTFLGTKGFEEAFPLAKLLDQASAVIEFARSQSDVQWGYESQARLRLLKECHFKGE